jgi:hypothetical protein
LLFFAADGGGIPAITCDGGGRSQHRENKMKQLLKLTVAPASALFALALVAMATPASAGPNEYCRQDITSGMRSCGFSSLEQCQAMSAGRGGDCYRDPYLTDASSALAYQPKSSLAKSVRKPVQNR